MRAVVTRAVHQAEELAAPLRKLGVDVILLPVIGIAPPLDAAPLKQAAADFRNYDWVIFSSVNAVEAFARELPSAALGHAKPSIATVGSATRQAAEANGFKVSLTPERYVAEALVEALGSENLNKRRVLLPAAAVTRDVIPFELRKRGATVDVVEAYRNVLPTEASAQAAQVFTEPYPDWVLFASSSAVGNLVALVGVEALRKTRIASIGPVTSASIRKHTLAVEAEAAPHTIQGLVEVVMSSNTLSNILDNLEK